MVLIVRFPGAGDWASRGSNELYDSCPGMGFGGLEVPMNCIRYIQLGGLEVPMNCMLHAWVGGWGTRGSNELYTLQTDRNTDR